MVHLVGVVLGDGSERIVMWVIYKYRALGEIYRYVGGWNY